MKNVSIGFIISAGELAFMFLITPFEWGFWFQKTRVPIEMASFRFGPLFFSANGNYKGPLS